MKKQNNDLLVVADDGQSYLVEITTPKNRFAKGSDESGKEDDVERKKE